MGGCDERSERCTGGMAKALGETGGWTELGLATAAIAM